MIGTRFCPFEGKERKGEVDKNETPGKKNKVYITRENNHEMCKACGSLLKRNQAGVS